VIPNISQKIHYVIAVVVFLSLLPVIIGALRARPGAAAKEPLAPSEAE